MWIGKSTDPRHIYEVCDDDGPRVKYRKHRAHCTIASGERCSCGATLAAPMRSALAGTFQPR